MSPIPPQKASRKSEEAPLKTLGIAIGALVLGAGPTAAEVLELRQYKLVDSRRDAFVELFDREFVESQEVGGMRLVGQFRDLDASDRFTWLRAFPDMATRQQQLAAFYSGPVWRTHRTAANAMIVDSDNVLLLRPANAGLGFGPAKARPAPGAATTPAGVVVAHIWRLWAEPDSAFAAAFEATVRPELEAAGLPVIGAYVPVREPNTFPALPVREGEKVFVWFTRTDSAQAYAAAVERLEARPGWKAKVAPLLADRLESPPLVRRLSPTPRSALR
jgi:hypothetical protein